MRSSQWEQRLIHQTEAAIVEACTRSLLAKHVDFVKPAEDLSHGGPDFWCGVGRQRFYVECACMTTRMVEEESNLSDAPSGRASYYRHLTPRFLHRAQAKERQCRVLTDGPNLLAIGTLHAMASALCFSKQASEFTLMSQSKLSCRMNPTTGDLVGEPRQETDLESSVFLRPARSGGASSFEPTRRDISAMLLCGFGVSPHMVHGVLHPIPFRRFNRELLSAIPFCRLTEYWAEGVFEIQWD